MYSSKPPNPGEKVAYYPSRRIDLTTAYSQGQGLWLRIEGLSPKEGESESVYLTDADVKALRRLLKDKIKGR